MSKLSKPVKTLYQNRKLNIEFNKKQTKFIKNLVDQVHSILNSGSVVNVTTTKPTVTKTPKVCKITNPLKVLDPNYVSLLQNSMSCPDFLMKFAQENTNNCMSVRDFCRWSENLYYGNQKRARLNTITSLAKITNLPEQVFYL